jgi:hypothetical protein
MKQASPSILVVTALALSLSRTDAFAPTIGVLHTKYETSSSPVILQSSMSLQHPHHQHTNNYRNLPYFLQEQQQQEKSYAPVSKTAISMTAAQESSASPSAPATHNKKASPKPKTADNKAHSTKQGILSPVVLIAKQALGDSQLNKVRAKAISLHSDVIASFVETASTPFGHRVLRNLFKAADVNHDGVLSKDELAQAVSALGFDWLQEKQVSGILQRADADANGAIDLEEFIQEAPKTLRTNLIKLAKKNGSQLGLLV